MELNSVDLNHSNCLLIDLLLLNKMPRPMKMNIFIMEKIGINSISKVLKFKLKLLPFKMPKFKIKLFGQLENGRDKEINNRLLLRFQVIKRNTKFLSMI